MRRPVLLVFFFLCTGGTHYSRACAVPAQGVITIGQLFIMDRQVLCYMQRIHAAGLQGVDV
jgi:hypothetical protein